MCAQAGLAIVWKQTRREAAAVAPAPAPAVTVAIVAMLAVLPVAGTVLQLQVVLQVVLWYYHCGRTDRTGALAAHAHKTQNYRIAALQHCSITRSQN